jgi:signal transduction histidine kinase
MLNEFLGVNRDVIVDATHARAARRRDLPLSRDAAAAGVSIFLDQLSETLRREAGGPDAGPASPEALGDGAATHGGVLRDLGFTVSEVVHFYGDICQAVTELAIEQGVAVTVEEFRILNLSLDRAIADAVTEHARLTADRASQDEREHIGKLAHEMRNHLNAALMAFRLLQGGVVPVNGSTGSVLGRSLASLRALIEGALSGVRLSAPWASMQRITVDGFLNDVNASVTLLANHHEIRFRFEPLDSAMSIDADPQLLASAVMNLVQNAFKFTHPGGQVVLRSRRAGNRVLLEVEDECGGLPEQTDPFQPFAERQGKDRSGLGLGLSIARQAVRANHGEISVYNLPGKGCIFSVNLPAADPEAAIAPAG